MIETQEQAAAPPDPPAVALGGEWEDDFSREVGGLVRQVAGPAESLLAILEGVL